MYITYRILLSTAPPAHAPTPLPFQTWPFFAFRALRHNLGIRSLDLLSTRSAHAQRLIQYLGCP